MVRRSGKIRKRRFAQKIIISERIKTVKTNNKERSVFHMGRSLNYKKVNCALLRKL